MSQIGVPPTVLEVNPLQDISIPRVQDAKNFARNIINVQQKQDPLPETVIAEKESRDEKKLYESCHSKVPYIYSKNKFKIWSNSATILTCPLDIHSIYYVSIYQRITDDTFNRAFANANWNECAKILIFAFTQARILQLASSNLKHITEYVSEILKSISNQLCLITGVNSSIGRTFFSKIVGGGIAALFCISFLKPNDDAQKYGAVANAFICTSLNWVWAVPLSAIVGKSIEAWSMLKNEPDSKDRSIVWKIGQVFECTLRELPIISGVFDYFGNNIVRPIMTSNQLVDVDNVPSIFTCSISHEKLEDPVFLHGWPFERHCIIKWLETKNEHPMTRKHASRFQVVKPTDDYMESFDSYTIKYNAELKKKNDEEKKKI